MKMPATLFASLLLLSSLDATVQVADELTYNGEKGHLQEKLLLLSTGNLHLVLVIYNVHDMGIPDLNVDTICHVLSIIDWGLDKRKHKDRSKFFGPVQIDGNTL